MRVDICTKILRATLISNLGAAFLLWLALFPFVDTRRRATAPALLFI